MSWVQCKAQKKIWLQQEHSWGQLSFFCNKTMNLTFQYVLCSKYKSGSPSFYNFQLLSKEHLECLLHFLCICPGMAVYQILIHFPNKSIHFLIKRNAVSYSQQNEQPHSGQQSNFFFFKHKSCIFYSDLKQHYSSIVSTSTGTWAWYSQKETRAQILTRCKFV